MVKYANPFILYTMKTILPTSYKLLGALTAAATAFIGSAFAQDSIVNFQFDDTNGAYLGGSNASQAADSGAGGAWSSGVGRVQNGKLNYGYSQNWRFTSGTGVNYVDQAAGTTGYRSYVLTTALDGTTHTTYDYEIVIPNYDVRQNWDAANTSAAGKGVQFELRSNGNSETVTLGFQTTSGGGVQAFANSTTGSFAGLAGSGFGASDTPVRFGNSGVNNPGISLKISGDLSSGAWTAYAKDTNNDTYVQVQTGTNLTSIASLRIASKNPSVNSWGGGDVWLRDPVVAGDYFSIDSITLDATAVPEPQTLALIAGFLAFGYVMVRRRK